MRRFNALRPLFAIAIVASAFTVASQTSQKKIFDRRSNPDEFWLIIDDVAKSDQLLPIPPSWTDQQFDYDQARYWWGRQQRNTPRGDVAVTDADITPQGVAYSFSAPFGMEISPTNTPEIWKLMVPVIKDACKLSVRDAKDGYMRTRPYVFYETGTCNPTQEKELVNNGSFPSGHSATGWAIAMVLSEVNPENITPLMQAGYRLGESRVICGYHWQSDVDAGRIAGASCFTALQSNEGFLKRLQKARDEFKRLKKEGKYTAPDPNHDFRQGNPD